jgi:hypothetical protein
LLGAARLGVAEVAAEREAEEQGERGEEDHASREDGHDDRDLRVVTGRRLSDGQVAEDERSLRQCPPRDRRCDGERGRVARRLVPPPPDQR